MASEYVFDVEEKDFEAQVLERSKAVPVVVDFWAEWCGPCRMLGPVLEREIEALGGKVLLAKVDTDRNQGLAMAFQIRGIPAVKAFRDGKLVAQFEGALPASEVKRFLARVLPSEEEEALSRARARLEAGDAAGAAELFEKILAQDPRALAARLGLVEARIAEGDLEAARAALSQIPEGLPEREEGEALLLRASFEKDAQAAGDEAALRERLAQAPDDLDARWGLASRLAASGRAEEALSEFLEIVRRSRAYREDGARRAMLALFPLLGPQSEAAARLRRQLAMAL